MTIQQWLNTILPIPQIVDIVGRVLPAFVFVAVMLLLIGYCIKLVGSETVFAPSVSLIVLFVCMAGAPWMVAIGQRIANGIVSVVGDAVPGMAWLTVGNNPAESSLAMDFTQPFAILAQYVGGKLTDNAPSAMPWDMYKWPDYIMRVVFILLTGLVACSTVFIMQVMLIIQKLILVASKLLVPVWIGALNLPVTNGSAKTFLKFVAGVMCWPVGWAFVHIGTMVAFQKLQPPSMNASLGELVLAFTALCFACLWPIVGTVGAPFLIAKMVTSGSSFAHDIIANFASVAGQHAQRGVQSGARVTGVLVGAGLGGAPGAALGASLGAGAGETMSLPLSSVTQSAEGLREGRQPVSTSRSRGAADAAIGFIKTRSK